jgi:hypothetical protein
MDNERLHIQSSDTGDNKPRVRALGSHHATIGNPKRTQFKRFNQESRLSNQKSGS